MSVTGGGLDLEDTLLNGQERHIEGSSSEIECEDVALALDLLVETVGNSGRGGFIDDTEDVEVSDRAGALGGGTLELLKYVGTVTTASVTVVPRYAPAVAQVLVLPQCEFVFPLLEMTLKGRCIMSAWISGASSLWPMRRFALKTVLTSSIATWFFAASPMKRSVSKET